MIDYAFTPRPWQRYAIALLVIAIAWSARIIFLSAPGPQGPSYLTFYPAVMVAALYGGLLPGLLATTLAAVSVLVRITPLEPYLIENPVNWLEMSVFLVSCFIALGICETMHRARVSLKKQTLELAETRDRAQSANKAKSMFLANMSHELRTPLNVIMGYSQLLQRELRLSSEQRQNLRTITDSGAHLLGLINDVLDISKAEIDNITIKSEHFDLHALFNELTNLYKPQTDAKALYLSVNGVEQLPRYVTSDPNKLRIILTNILANAVKFTQAGGITVNALTQKQTQDTLRLVVTVEDSGEGIAPEEMDKLFMFFEQTQSGRNSQKGSGLGLAISERYARAMNGKISVKSRLGISSTFCVELDIIPSNHLKRTGDADRGRVTGLAPGQKRRVLVAEDSGTNRYLLATLLEKVGFEVREAADGREAVALFKQWQPHFIWMDVRMPKMDGMEATRRIKAAADGRKTKVVALTGRTLEEERKEIMAAGCDGYVRKPFREDEIFGIMEKELGVAYQFENTTIEKIAEENFSGQIPEQLRRLPSNLHDNLKDAVLRLDVARISDLIDEIDVKDPDLGRQLKQISDQFNFHHLLELIKASSPNPKEVS